MVCAVIYGDYHRSWTKVDKEKKREEIWREKHIHGEMGAVYQPESDNFSVFQVKLGKFHCDWVDIHILDAFLGDRTLIQARVRNEVVIGYDFPAAKCGTLWAL